MTLPAQGSGSRGSPSSDLTLRPLRLVRKGWPAVVGSDWLKGMEEAHGGEGKERKATVREGGRGEVLQEEEEQE